MTSRPLDGAHPASPCYVGRITKEQLVLLLERVESWPEEAQEELMRSLDEIASRHEPVYELDDEERADILEGLAEIERGEVMTEEEVREMFRQLREETLQQLRGA